MENFLDLQELISLSSLQSFANDKVILFYNASNIRDLEAKGDTTKLNTVYEFYKNLMPDALYAEFFNSSFGGITYKDEYTAQDFAETISHALHYLLIRVYLKMVLWFGKILILRQVRRSVLSD